MSISCLGPMLGVLDLKKTIEFYTSALGFEVTGSFEHDGKLVWAKFASGKRWLVCDNPILTCNQIPPECIGPDDRRTKKNMLFYYYPSNVVELHQSLSCTSRSARKALPSASCESRSTA